MSVTIQVTSDIHQVFSDQIVMTMQLSAKKRGNRHRKTFTFIHFREDEKW